MPTRQTEKDKPIEEHDEIVDETAMDYTYIAPADYKEPEKVIKTEKNEAYGHIGEAGRVRCSSDMNLVQNEAYIPTPTGIERREDQDGTYEEILNVIA